jgi:hypothetical protein
MVWADALAEVRPGGMAWADALAEVRPGGMAWADALAEVRPGGMAWAEVVLADLAGADPVDLVDPADLVGPGRRPLLLFFLACGIIVLPGWSHHCRRDRLHA